MTLPIHQTEKNGLVYVRSESDYIHSSFLSNEGHVLVYESIPGNVPATSLGVYDTEEEYIASIKDVSWINEPEYIVRNNIANKGFPFLDA